MPDADCEIQTLSFADDGRVPNNRRFPLIAYRQAVDISDRDPETVFAQLFADNGWPGAWVNGIFSFQHFHSNAHEVLGIARGRARVQFGGEAGKAVDVKASDVVVVPAGVGHCRVSASGLSVVGSYPSGGRPDLLRAGEGDHRAHVAAVASVAAPDMDPVFGADGPLRTLWAG